MSDQRRTAAGPTPLEELAGQLRSQIAGEVRTGLGDRALYSTDASNYQRYPVAIVTPRTASDVEATLAWARRYGYPILPRGCGTSLAGQGCNAAVVLDFSRHMRRILDLNAGRRRARVEPGVICDQLRDAAAAHGLTFAPDPATHSHCTLGGMIGNNACGAHSVMGGKTVDNVEALEILTADGLRMRVGPMSEDLLDAAIAAGGRTGAIYARLRNLRDRYAALIRARFPRIPRRVSGFNLDELLPENGFHLARALVGSEGACVTVLDAVVRLLPFPAARSLAVIGFENVYAAAAAVPALLEHQPLALEGFDDELAQNVRKRGQGAKLGVLPAGAGWLLVELGGETLAEAEERAQRLANTMEGRAVRGIRVYSDAPRQQRVWEIRESGLGASARVPGEPDTWPGWEDSAVAPEKLPEYLRELAALKQEFGYKGALYGHFGQGCVHSRMSFRFHTQAEVAQFRRFMESAADLAVRYGGSLSGEHGDGQARGELLERMYGRELVEAFAEFKAIWDPEGAMNPGMVAHPYRLDEDLRFGPGFQPMQAATRMHFPEDQDQFARAVARCVGVGKCRRPDTGAMCPSYQATQEERHSTRGRARLLLEMLQPGRLEGAGWRSEEVRDALDLCLACKACKSECPTQVDMAAYKAEFLSRYYAGRRRPLPAYLFGWVDQWARLGSLAPGMVNRLLRSPTLGPALKHLAGVAAERRPPQLARQSLQAGLQAEKSRRRAAQGEIERQAEGSPGGEETHAREVILWPDTFTNYFEPGIGMAAKQALESLGWRVRVPKGHLCCGRPLYDYGWLAPARLRLQKILERLRPAIERELPLIVLEPSCLSVFKDELLRFFPDHEPARRLSRQAMSLGEFCLRQRLDLDFERYRRNPGGAAAPRRRALVHTHCHAKAGGAAAEQRCLAALGLEVAEMQTGCCGMAGGFGFERSHFAVSQTVAAQRLLPAVEAAEAGTLLVSDGFSCRQQVAQNLPRRMLHTAEAIDLRLRELRGERLAEPYPETSADTARNQDGGRRPKRRAWLPLALAGIGLGAAIALCLLNGNDDSKK